MSLQLSDGSDRETAEAYEEGLAQLTDNARHVIMHLTELAHDYSRDKKERIIVSVIERHIRKVKASHKLPALYLMDSIMKNHQVPYKDLFQQNIVSTFASVFLSAPEKVRSLMYKLRNTWNDIFTATKLYQLDNKVKAMDPAWPIVSPPSSKASSSSGGGSAASGNIHVNPAVFNRPRDENAPIFEELQRKERELLELRKKKIELELEVARKEVEERQTKVEREPSKSSQQRSSKKTGDERSSSSQRRDPRIREKASDSSNKGSDNGSADGCKASDSASSPSSPSNRYDKSSSSHRSSKSSSSSFSPSKSKSSSSSHDRSRKSKESPSSSRSKKGSSSSSKRSSSKSSSKASSPPASPKKRGRDPSSSPSPPPSEQQQLGNEAPVVMSAKDQQSRVKDLGRIPKKVNKRSDDSPLDLHGFTEEEPQAELFNQGKFSKSLNNKRRGPKDESSSPPEKKKKELPLDLFGMDGPSENMKMASEPIVDPMPSPSSTGWAKFKETNPDEFHTPIRNSRRHGPNDRFNIGNDFRGGRGGGFGHRRSRTDRRHCGNNSGVAPGSDNFGPFEHVNNNSPNSIFNNKMIEMVLQNMQNPEHVRNEVIPTIVKQAQENLQSGRMNSTQFSELMRQVMTLKEQAMMIQAERRSNDPPFAAGAANHKAPPPPQSSGNAPNFNQPNSSSLPFFNQQIFNGDQPQQQSRPPFRPHVRDLPQASMEDLEMIKNDPVKTIPIDGESREIRQYNEVCTVVMGDCDIKELSFQPGTRRVIIDDNIIVPCELDVKHYTSVMIEGVEHNIKIGAPTRELWVDGQWYECYFDNKVRVRLGMNFHTFFLEGPAPTVKIGERRQDLCPGRVNLIIDADFSRMTPIFLDAKPQQFDIDGKPHVIRFVEGLKTVLINGHPYRTEFGGMPMVIFVDGIKHFVRLTVLPRGVMPGLVKIRNMPMGLGISNVTPRSEDEVRPPVSQASSSPPPPQQPMEECSKGSSSPPPMPSESENSNGASLENMDEVGSSSAFDKLLPLFPKSATSAESDKQMDKYKSDNQPAEEASEVPTEASPKKDDAGVDVHNLWKQLLGAGLVSSESNGGPSDGSKGKKSIPGLDTSISQEEEVNKENMNPDEETPNPPASKAPPTPVAKVSDIKPILLKSHDNSLKERQQSIVNLLYDPSALQCKNCGLRYSPVDMISYSQHLDWHFRMKRREKDNAKKAQSRRWYFERMDWIVSDEIEEEEKENTNTEPNETEKEIPTVPASRAKEDNTCPICKEEFEQFYKDDTDEDGKWLLYNAIQREDGTFHPQCYQDYTEDKNNSSFISSQEEDSLLNQSHSEELMDVVKEEEATPKSEVKVEKEEPMDTTTTNEAVVKEEEEDSKEDVEPKVKEEEEEGLDNEAVEVKTEPCSEEESGGAKDEDLPVLEEETLDGMEDKSPAVLSTHKPIRVNLLPGSGASSPKEPPVAEDSAEVSSQEEEPQAQEEEPPEDELDPAAIVQNSERPSDYEDSKPGLKGKKLILVPTQKKDGELSGLCSIM